MKIPRLSKITLGKKRRQEIAFMIIAVLLLFVGVPLSLHLVAKWNAITPTGDYVFMEEDLFFSENIGAEKGKIGYSTGTTFNAQNSVLWGDNYHTVVMEDATGTDTQHLYFFMNWTIDDLLGAGHYSFRFNVTSPGSDWMELVAYTVNGEEGAYTIDRTFIPSRNDQSIISNYPDGCYDDATNISGYLNTTALNLLIAKTEIGRDSKLAFHMAVSPGAWETADVITFKISYYEPPVAEVNENTVIEYGAMIIGILLMGVAMVSTPWWNPASPDNPGIVDRGLSKIFGKLRRKKK